MNLWSRKLFVEFVRAWRERELRQFSLPPSLSARHVGTIYFNRFKNSHKKQWRERMLIVETNTKWWEEWKAIKRKINWKMNLQNFLLPPFSLSLSKFIDIFMVSDGISSLPFYSALSTVEFSTNNTFPCSIASNCGVKNSNWINWRTFQTWANSGCPRLQPNFKRENERKTSTNLVISTW